MNRGDAVASLMKRFNVVDIIPLGLGVVYTTCLSCGARSFHESCAGHEPGGKLLFVGSVCGECLAAMPGGNQDGNSGQEDS